MSTPGVRLFPIVGIGCSAGGLEALEALLNHVAADCGMAFIVIQHLNPNYLSNLPELLQRATAMTVAEATERTTVKPGCVYVIPPNKDLSLVHGVLHLSEPTEKRGLRLPIDFFLRTLAEDRQFDAIGVVLSGMGADGMLGLGAIKEKGGLTLAQDPADAEASSMPGSAIKAGVVDIVAPAGELVACIAGHLHHAAVPRKPARSALDRIIALLRQRSGNDLSQYKPSTLYRRIERRITLLQIDGINPYVDYLHDNPQELDLLFKELLIGVTNFFRDPAVWEFLRDTALPALFARRPNGQAFRAWVPACSTGEEAYTLAIVFKEALELVKPAAQFSLQIYATDLDVDAVDKARKAWYPAHIAEDLTPPRLARHFVAEEGGYRVHREIREGVIFAPQNVISDPPFTRLDIVSCRNLLIYFAPDLQKKILPLFHYALNRDGILVLGSAETVGGFGELFAPLEKKARIFQRIDLHGLKRLNLPAQMSSSWRAAAEGGRGDYRDSLEYQTDQLIQQRYSPAAVLVNSDGDILYISGRTGKYLEPAAGKVNINIHAMAREGLREALSGVILNALQRPQPLHLDGIQVDANGHSQTVNVTVQGIDKPDALRNRVLVVFNDAPGRKPRRRIASPRENTLTLELDQLREVLHITDEDMQSSLEEIKSANEELQVTNEELSTSKEELQSMNEELQTINAKLQSKLDELTWARDDMTNLFNSTEIATIFLDNDMKLRLFTPHASRLFKLLPADVGRDFSDIVTDLDYPHLPADALAVLSTLIVSEKQICTRDGRWVRVRIIPYRTQDNVIDGVVLTFIDITALTQLEAQLRRPPHTSVGET
jgi:chemotaxis methyl-accepting protein methylase/PAS domain-containing protein